MAVDGGPELVQLLTPEGERVEHPNYALDPTPDQVRGWYRDLVLVRRFDTVATALQRQGELGLWASLLGQEATQIGSGRALAPGDFVFPTFREHGVGWCRDIDPLQVLGLFRGTTNGGWNPLEHNMALYTIVIGDQVPHAVGYAMGLTFDGASDACVVYFGDGATSQGDVNEGFIWGSVFNAPVVFFCTNNQWAISEPSERQTRIPLYRRAAGFGFPGIRVDGNDIFAVYAVTQAALAAAREGQGPTLIESFTYRMGAHTTSDDPTRYRSGAELEIWKHRDPIERVKSYLARNGHADSRWFAAVEAEGDELAERLRTGCRALEAPAATAMFDNIYATPHPRITEQREQLVDYLASFVTPAGSR